MKGTKYLSDVLDTSHFEKGFMNVIFAPCGSGKTTAAINHIAPLASSPKKVIYLIDTRIGKERLSNEDGMTAPCPYYDNEIMNGMGFWENDDKIVVTTYAQFGIWCDRHSGFAEKYEYIICDEPQNLVLFSKIGTKDKTDIPVHKIARASICAAVNNGNVMVIAISATPKPLIELDCKLKDIPIDRTDLRHYEEHNTIYYARPEDALNAVPLGQRGGLYVKHVQPMKQFAEILRGRGFNPLMIWSLDYKEPMSAEQLAARTYIIENEAVPDEYDVFLFNATAETSINIRSRMDFFIAHSPGNTHITQSRGRYRGDLETLYVWDKKSPYVVVVPDEFLDRVLFREDLKELRARLNMVKDAKGHEPSIDRMLTIITNCEYSYEKFKKNRKDAYIIRREEQKSGEDPI